jgi:hypothetical protein
MTSTNTSPSPNTPRRLAAVRLPIDEPIRDADDAVAKLRQCDSTELHRSRKHHRRALESLQNGGYSCLSDRTREDLADRLRENLNALNQVLDANATAEPNYDTSSESASVSSRFRAFFNGLW